MCQAELNVSTQECRHRWYRLVKSCNPEANTNLANCTSRLSFQGMEVRCAFCPFCDGWTCSLGDMRLIGSDRHGSLGGVSRHSSFGGGATLINARKESRSSRRGSLARTDSSVSVTSTFGDLEHITRLASEKNRAMNSRIESYLAKLPSWLEPSSGASIASARRGSSTSSSDDTIIEEEPTTNRSSADPTPAVASAAPDSSRSSFIGRSWSKSKRLSISLFK